MPSVDASVLATVVLSPRVGKAKCSSGTGVDLRELRMGVGFCTDDFGGIGTCQITRHGHGVAYDNQLSEMIPGRFAEWGTHIPCPSWHHHPAHKPTGCRYL